MIRKLIWPLLAVFTLILREILAAHSSWTEYAYSRGLFSLVRRFWDLVLGWLPFPAVYLLFALLLGYLWKGIKQLLNRSKPLKARLIHSAWRIIAFVSGLITLFYWLWGFNYSRIPVEKQLSLPEIELTPEDIKSAFEAQTQYIFSLRQQIQPDSGQIISAPQISAKALENAVSAVVSKQLSALQLPVYGKPRGRQPFWPGFLLRFGAAGIYNVFTGECNIDQGLHFLIKPYDLAHELCHGYGWGDEGTCNFLAYLTLREAPDLQLRYSAELEYWRALARTYRRLDPEAYHAIALQFPSGFRNDLLQIQQKIAQYPEFFEAFRYTVYDHFLKSQGMADGMKNYDNIIRLVAKYRKIEESRK